MARPVLYSATEHTVNMPLALTRAFSVAVLVVLSGGIAHGSPAAPRGEALRQAPVSSAQPLDQLLAPIALYPDQLLGQVLMCATDPVKVRQLDAFLKNNAALTGTDLQQAVRDKGFEPGFVMLALFPDVVAKMAVDQAWTMRLGEAFTNDRAGVMASIQRLRAQSQAAGTLKSTPQQTVETKTTASGEKAIVIEPANPQVVYVPQYNPTTVYTTAPSSTTVVVQQESSSTGAAVAGAAVGFAAGIAIGAAFDNDYYYGPRGWHGAPYMYNDAWDDWYDDREDAREDFYENREDARENYYENREDARENASQQRTERANTQSQQRTERQQTRQETRPQTQADVQQRRTEAQGRAEQARSSASTSGASLETRGAARDQGRAAPERSGTKSDAFSNYSSGRSERAASSRGQRSRSSSGGSRGGRRR